MDTSLLSGLSAGGLGGIIIAVCIILYKCCEKKKYKSHLGCIDFQVEADTNAQGATAPMTPVVPMTPNPTPTSTPVLTAVSSPKERKMSIIEEV